MLQTRFLRMTSGAKVQMYRLRIMLKSSSGKVASQPQRRRATEPFIRLQLIYTGWIVSNGKRRRSS
jgi:hypothetical protein